MEVLRDAKAEGLCRFTGITGNSADGLARVLGDVNVDICLTATNYDILHRRAPREVIPLAKTKNVTVVLGMVIRFLRDMPEQLERLYAVQRQSGTSVLELTIRYLLSDRDVSVILVGAAKPAEIEKSVEAAEKGPLPADLHRTLEKLGSTGPAKP